MNSHLVVIVRVFVQIRRKAKELSKSLYICRHRPVGDRLDLFQIGPDAMLAHDATKKWYLASRKYTLLEVGVQLMLAH